MRFLAFDAEEILGEVDTGSSDRSRRCSPNLVKFDENRGTLDFVTRCTTSRNAWSQRVAIEDWDIVLSLVEEPEEEFEEEEISEEVPEEIIEEDIKEETLIPEEEPLKTSSFHKCAMDWKEFKAVVPEVLNADIKVACNCPAFAYQGYAYISDGLDVGETTLRRYKNAPIPEGRAPVVRNPDEVGIICKHLIAVLNRYF